MQVLRHQYLPWIGAPDFGRSTIARCSVLSNGKRAAGGGATGKPYACAAKFRIEVRIRLPPAVSRPTMGSLGAEAHLPFVPRYRMFESTSPPVAHLRTIIPSVTGIGWSIPLSLIRRPGSLFCPGSARGRRLMGFDEEQVGQSSARALWLSASSAPR